MATFRTSRLFDGIFITCLVIFIGWAWVNRIKVGDSVFFASYKPSPRVQQIAASAGLSAEGRRLLYRTDPQFVDLSVITKECGEYDDLGCLSPKGNAYILDSSTGTGTVTAVHEMLHLAYRRLNTTEKDQLAPAIDEAAKSNAADGLEQQLEGITDTAERRDEAHSILGTEYGRLPSALETYYRIYFVDRSKLIHISDDTR